MAEAKDIAERPGSKIDFDAMDQLKRIGAALVTLAANEQSKTQRQDSRFLVEVLDSAAKVRRPQIGNKK
jgi:hypothetical protein